MKMFKSRMKTAAVMLVVAGTLIAGTVQAVGFSNPASGCRYSAFCMYGGFGSRCCAIP